MKKTMTVLTVALIAAAIGAPMVMAQGHHHHGRHHCEYCTSWGPGGQAGPRGFAPADAPRYNPDTVTTLRGAVTAVEVLPEGGGRRGGLHLTLHHDGKTIEVHLGPSWFVEKEAFKPGKGDTVEITGSLVGKEGGSYLIAREVKKGDKVLKLRDEQGFPLWSGSRRR